MTEHKVCMTNQVSDTGLSVWLAKTFSTSFLKLLHVKSPDFPEMFIYGFCRSVVTFGVDKIQDEHPGLWLDETYFTFFFQEQNHVSQWSHQTCQKCACRVLTKCCYFPKSKMIFLASILPRHFIVCMFSRDLHAKSPKWLEIFT